MSQTKISVYYHHEPGSQCHWPNYFYNKNNVNHCNKVATSKVGGLIYRIISKRRDHPIEGPPLPLS